MNSGLSAATPKARLRYRQSKSATAIGNTSSTTAVTQGQHAAGG